MQILSKFLKMPPVAALEGFFVAAPSMLALIQEEKGGDHRTSLIMGALGGFILTLQAFRILNSNMSPL